MRRQRLLDEVAEMLATLACKVNLLNSVNFTDLSVHAEDFYCKLLNAIYGYSLINLNADNKNAEAIDLGDIAKRIAVQVTASGTTAKLRATVDTFVARGLSKNFDRLIVLQITGEANHKQGKITDPSGFEFDKRDDVWDNRTLLCAITGLPTDQIESIHRMLRDAGIGTRKEFKALATLGAVLILLLFGFGIYAVRSSANRETLRKDRDLLRAERNSLRTEMVEMQKQLQDKLSKGHALFAYVDVSADWANALSREDADVRPLAERLSQIVDKFEKVFDEGVLPPDDLRVVRLARATVANGEGRYLDADSLITDADVEQSTNELANLLFTKAEALFGLWNWDGAFSHYQKADTISSSSDAKVGMANSLYYLGRYDEADVLWVEILKQLDAEFEHGDRNKGRAAAVGMVNYAGVLLEQGKVHESHVYTVTALTLLRMLRLTEDDERIQRELDLDIAKTHARLGHIFEALSFYAVAERNLKAAIEIYQTFKFGEYPPEYAAEVLDDLGMLLVKQNRPKEAAAATGAACVIYKAEVERGSVNLKHDWAVCLQHFAKVTIDEKPEEANEAMSRAVELLEPLAKDSESKDELAMMFVYRGAVRLRLDLDAAAELDFSQAATIVSDKLEGLVREQIEQATARRGRIQLQHDR